VAAPIRKLGVVAVYRSRIRRPLASMELAVVAAFLATICSALPAESQVVNLTGNWSQEGSMNTVQIIQSGNSVRIIQTKT
jgi:hypothetical protein